MIDRASVKPGAPYAIRCIRKDGSEFDALVGGAVIGWQGNPGLVITLMDISEQKKIKERLRDRERDLQRSLNEKEVLLREIYHRTKNNMLVIEVLVGMMLSRKLQEFGFTVCDVSPESNYQAGHCCRF